MGFLFSSSFFTIAAISAVIFIVLDLLWLAVISKGIYYKHMHHLSNIQNGSIKFILPVGIGVQAIIAVGLTVFVSMGLKIDPTLATAIGTGAFAGFVMYCTYDLTNLSFMKGYTYFIAIFDIAWGTAQGIFSGIYVYYLSQWQGLI